MPKVYVSPIVSNTQAGSDVFLLVLNAPGIARQSHPGNFIQVKIDFPDGGLWRRPFSILEPDNDNIKILYKTLGRGTRHLSTLKSNQTLSILGPLGNSFTIPDKDSTILLAGGGIGVPPMYYLSKHLLEKGFPAKNIHFFNGAANYDTLVYLEETAELGINVYAVTEDGTMGIKGLITEGIQYFIAGLKKTSNTSKIIAYSCGPMPMLRAIGQLLQPTSIPCEMALEALMPCGFGICMGCAVKIRDDSNENGYVFKRVCTDGPVFHADQIIWDKD